MENIHRPLKQKSRDANKSEHFVFLPNDLTEPSAPTDMNPSFRTAIAVKNEGNICFKRKEYDRAIRHYDRAIGILEEINTKSTSYTLSVCYQNRAAANAQKKKFSDSISDASKAIKSNDHYAKAYYRRAMGYFEQKKYFCALQDIIQACVMERFQHSIYRKAAVTIIAEIGKYFRCV